MSDVPQYIAAHPALAAEFERILAESLALAQDQDGLTVADLRKILATSSGVFVQIVSSYSTLSGEQKKTLVDAALMGLVRRLKPYVVDAAKALIAGALPWYLGWLPYVVGWLIKWNAIDQVIVEVPAISQAAYDAAKFIWTKLRKANP